MPPERKIAMDALKTMAESGIVPVVVLDDAKDAVPTARALLAGGIRVMEITFRTAAAEESIRNVARECPEILVGAGTVITLEQCRAAVNAGARFIVAPGYDEEVVSWCVEHSIPVTPGCVTPTEIMAAMKHGLKVVKFFPANVYGGLKAMKSLSAPFGGIKFIPTGGVSDENSGEFAAAPFIHAVGGSWICPKAEIAQGNFEKITQLCANARAAYLGYEVAHVGVNTESEEASMAVCEALKRAFSFAVKPGNSSNFVSGWMEIMKSPFLGAHGHIAIRTNNMICAIADLERRGFAVDMETAKYKSGKLLSVYLRQEIGGFALHLLAK